YRILSFVADMGLMILLIDGIHFSSFCAKIIKQVVEVILNYFLSKFLILQ
ncbi:GtrA family protein, partial [Enterococcus faecalis]